VERLMVTGAVGSLSSSTVKVAFWPLSLTSSESSVVTTISGENTREC
jgi:hypothetical protein